MSSKNSVMVDASQPLFDGKRQPTKAFQDYAKKVQELLITRLSRNFILRDFMYSSEAALMGLPNLPEDWDMVIRAGKALCEKILEPITEKYGRPAIAFGYQCREAIEAGMTESQRKNPRSSCPHMWDRKSFGDDVYARVDLLSFAVEDGKVSKHDFGLWCMMNLDIDLLQQWSNSNGFCITISPRPRRVWHEWTAYGKGDNGGNRIEIMGADFWTRVYPSLPEHERPKYGPSCTDGSMRWSRGKR